MYINDLTKEQQTWSKLKSEANPVTIPANGTEIITLELDEWWFIHAGVQPVYDSDTHKLESANPVKTDVYKTSWDVIPLSPTEMDNNLTVAQSNKYSEIWNEYERRIAETNDDAGTSKDPHSGVDKANKSQKRLTKKSKGGSLNAKEEADEEWYDEYLDWSDENHDAADSACDVVELLTAPSAVNAYDVVNDPSWTVFVAP